MTYYAGIGSRKTPQHILSMMHGIAAILAPKGYILRSGHAGGADTAFETGCISNKGKKEIFLPWTGFNKAPVNHPDYIVPPMSDEILKVAALHHPNWNACSDTAKKMHARNLYQVMGETNSSFVICWTENGIRKGGTGQALRYAETLQIPIFDLAIEGTLDKLGVFLDQLENQLHG